jgi:hypothetical protein
MRQRWMKLIRSLGLPQKICMQQMKYLRWVSRVPGILTAAKMLLDNMPQEAFNQNGMSGYRIAPCQKYYLLS